MYHGIIVNDKIEKNISDHNEQLGRFRISQLLSTKKIDCGIIFLKYLVVQSRIQNLRWNFKI